MDVSSPEEWKLSEVFITAIWKSLNAIDRPLLGRYLPIWFLRNSPVRALSAAEVKLSRGPV
jgi:hypothetical protein